MATIELNGVFLETDDKGFLEEPDKWTPALAEVIAKAQSLDHLTEEHWKVINYVRSYYLEFGVPPMIKKVCREMGIDLKILYELFPQGPIMGACRVAGLAQPTGCV